MLFNVESDTQSSITLYVIPDSGGSVPSIVVRNEGVDLLSLESNQTRPEIAEFGRHATGQCGFVVDTNLLPDLASYQHLEIFEPNSKLIIYRRPRPEFVGLRVFRLETHLLPLWRFDDALNGRFQYWYKGIDRYGRETAQQTFNLINTDSIYASGRLYMRHVEQFLSRGLKAIAIIRDPYAELAERLIILKNVGEQTTDLLGPRDAMIYEGVIAELAQIEVLDGPTCKRFFRKAPGDLLNVLSNPFVRQLTANIPTEPPPQNCIGMALQTLAEFAVLGLRAEPKDFTAAVSELLGVDPTSVPVVKEFSKVGELGNALREIREIEVLLEHDLELFHHMKEAFGSAAPRSA